MIKKFNFSPWKIISGFITTKLNLGIKVGGNETGQSKIASGLVVNEDGGNLATDDFRVETVGEANAFVVDASDDRAKFNVPVIHNNKQLGTAVAGALEFYDDRFHITDVDVQRTVDRTSNVAVETVTCENTTDEVTLWTGEMPANSLRAGNVFKFHCDGLVQNDGATSDDEVTLRVRVGGNEVLSLSPTTRAMATGSLWHIDANATQRTIGTSGQRAVHIHIDIDGVTEGIVTTATIDTTANMDVTVTAQWATANVNDIISLRQAFMEYKN